MTAHAELPGGWRTPILQDAILGMLPPDRALHLIGVRGGDLATRARRDLQDAIDAHTAGDTTTAMAAAADLAEEIRTHRQGVAA